MQPDRGITLDDRDPLISTEQLAAIVGNSDVRVVDCRFDLTHPSAGHACYLEEHIPGAVYADLDKDLAATVGPGTGRHPLPDPAELARTFGRLGIDAKTCVVVYDECSGALAARTWWLLRWLGHARVALLEGGIAHWRALGLPVESCEMDVDQKLFKPDPQAEMVLETQEIVAAGAERAHLRLVDARDAARFRGEIEPIDTVAGHIPGALNLPFSESLNDDGTWKDRTELKRMLENVLGSDGDAPWSVMCGSGVTACHLAIAGLLAGLPNPRLYVGSWSEWIAHPDRSVATGAAQKE